MGINATNTQSYYLEALKNQQPQNNFRLANSYVNTPMFNNNVQQPAVDSFNNKTVTPADGKDDGSIGFVKAVGNLFKGVGNFFKGMVCDENGKFSITRTLTTIGIGAAIGVACAFLPTIAVAGMTFSTLGLISAGFGAIAAYHVGDAAIDIISADTDAEAEQGWQNLGSGLTEGGLAYLGYRASGGIMAKDTVAPTPSGSTPKTPKTPKAPTEEAPVEPTRTSAPKAEAEAKATEPKGEHKTTQSEPKTKPKPVTEPVIEKEYIDRETLSPVKEKWQGKTLLERSIKTDDGLVTTSYRNGKVKSIFTNGDMFQELKVFANNGRTIEETYFRNMGTLYIERGNKNLAIPHVSEKQFEEVVKLSQKYAKIPEVELDRLYGEVLSGNPKNISFMEFNVLEEHRDVYKLTIPKTSEATQIKEHHFLNGKNNLYRDNPEKLKGNGKVKRDYTKEEWNALPEEEQDICFENRLIKLYNEEMKQIDKALQALPPLEKDCVFYRGIGERFIPDSIINGKVGDIVVPDNGYAYTAFNRELADRFGGHQYIIRTPKGAKVSRNMEHGGEAVFPRNAEYRLISKSKTPANKIYPEGQWRIELEYILPKS